MKELILERLNKISEMAHRINLETPYACFVRDSGHTQEIEIEIAESRESYNTKLFFHNFFYDEFWFGENEEYFAEMTAAVIGEMSRYLNFTEEKSFTATVTIEGFGKKSKKSKSREEVESFASKLCFNCCSASYEIKEDVSYFPKGEMVEYFALREF